jgi:hypothetical protein
MDKSLEKITLQEKEELKKNIKNLTPEQHKELFFFIRKETNIYSENKNGVFINLKNLKDETIYKIQNYVKKSIEYNKMKEKYTNNTISTFSISFDTFSSDPSLPLYTIKTETESPKNNNKILVLKPKYLQFSGAKNRIYKQCKDNYIGSSIVDIETTTKIDELSFDT